MWVDTGTMILIDILVTHFSGGKINTASYMIVSYNTHIYGIIAMKFDITAVLTVEILTRNDNIGPSFCYFA